MKKIIEVLKRIFRNPATKAVGIGLVLFLIDNPSLFNIFRDAPIVAILTVIIAAMGLYVNPSTPGVTDDQRSFIKEVIDVFKLILKSKTNGEETVEENDEEVVLDLEEKKEVAIDFTGIE